MQGKDLFWHSLVRPELAVVVSKGMTLLNAMQDSLIMADLQATFSGRQGAARAATVGSSVAATSHLVDKGPVGWGCEVRRCVPVASSYIYHLQTVI